MRLYMKKGAHRIYNGTMELTNICRYSEVGVVHTAWHWIRAMYEVRTGMDIDI